MNRNDLRNAWRSRAQVRAAHTSTGDERGRVRPAAGFTAAVERPDLCRPVVHVDWAGAAVPDPLELLGLAPEEAADPAHVRAAYFAARRAAGGEDDERAELLEAARDRLLLPENVLARRLGDARVPDPVLHGLPAPKRGPWGESAQPAPPGVASRARLLGILALYALLEEELRGE